VEKEFRFSPALTGDIADIRLRKGTVWQKNGSLNELHGQKHTTKNCAVILVPKRQSRKYPSK